MTERTDVNNPMEGMLTGDLKNPENHPKHHLNVGYG